VRLAPETFRQGKISDQRLENVNPCSHRAGMPDLRRATAREGADQIGNESIGSPVSAADNIACARGGNADRRDLVGEE